MAYPRNALVRRYVTDAVTNAIRKSSGMERKSVHVSKIQPGDIIVGHESSGFVVQVFDMVIDTTHGEDDEVTMERGTVLVQFTDFVPLVAVHGQKKGLSTIKDVVTVFRPEGKLADIEE